MQLEISKPRIFENETFQVYIFKKLVILASDLTLKISYYAV